MKKSNLFLAFSLLFAFAFMQSCQKTEQAVPAQEQNNERSGDLKTQIDYCGDPITVNLVDFDETMFPGTVTVGNDENMLYVTYDVTAPYSILNLAVYAGPADQLPSGNSINGDGTGSFEAWTFPYSYYPYFEVNSYTFEIDLSTLPECFILVTYAKINGPDGIFYAWGKSNTKYPGYYFDYCVQDCNPPLGACETMYAYGDSYAQCFIGLPELTSKKWGWTNGPLAEGTYEFDIWAGAGQCDLSKGTHVGTLDVEYSGGQVTVTYTMFDDYSMTETHLYVGNDILPKSKNNKYTVAPGQYPYKHGYPMGETTDTYELDGFSGDIYVIAHGVVCDEQ
jgi:hypothetical protein